LPRYDEDTIVVKVQPVSSAGNAWGPPHLEGDMRAYLWTTGTIFGLIVVAHVARVITESHELARDPFYVLLTVLAAGLCVWAVRLLRVQPQ
jgi:hypothetical protein